MHNTLFTIKAVYIAVFTTLLIMLGGCSSNAAKPSEYNEVKLLENNALNIDSLTPNKIKVSSEKSWQSSGVFIDNGELVSVKAHGKWSPAPLMLQWSGAEGSAFFGAEVPYITGGALMAKLGHDGSPFEIGIHKTFQANDYGMLYFAMNDPFNWQYDNSGELDVEIFTSTNATNNNKGIKQANKIIAYNYDDKTGRGSLSAEINNDHFKTRNWMIKKIGEIASSKRVALRAGSESLQGGSYQVLDENTADGVLTINFETLW